MVSAKWVVLLARAEFQMKGTQRSQRRRQDWHRTLVVGGVRIGWERGDANSLLFLHILLQRKPYGFSLWLHSRVIFLGTLLERMFSFSPICWDMLKQYLTSSFKTPNIEHSKSESQMRTPVLTLPPNGWRLRRSHLTSLDLFIHLKK